MPTKPSFTVPGILAAGLQIILGGGAKCRVFYPGTYTAVPPLPNGEHAYFVSGVYYFEFPNSSSTWTIDGDTLITAGQRGVTTDTAVPVSNCSTMTDATALAQATALPYVASMTSTLAYGTTWIVGGSSKIDFKKGQATLFTPYQTPAEEDETPMNFIAVESNGAGYKGVSLNQPVITGGSNNTLMQLNAKLYAPTAAVDVFSTNSTVAAAKGGVVAYTIALKASAAGSDALAISARPGKGKPRPPFRTVKIVSKDGAGGGSASNTAVATISNYPPYSVTVKSWRTGTD
jgi:hypothetical protein